MKTEETRNHVGVQTRWTLHPDTETVDVDLIDPATRNALEAELPENGLAAQGARLLRRRKTRGGSLLVDNETTALLDCFGEGETLARAIFRWSDARGSDAESVLRQAWPTVERLVRRGFLVNADAPQPTESPAASIDVGQVVDLGPEGGGRWRALRRLRRLEDSETYLLRSEGRAPDTGWTVPHAVLKLQRPDSGVGDLTVEAEALDALGGDGAPRLLGRGTLGGGPSSAEPCWDFLLLEHIPGLGVREAAAELRESGPRGRAQQLGLLLAVARAYAALHARGWLHGDVHAGNLLVDGGDVDGRDSGGGGGGEVTLLDFALARRVSDPPGSWPGTRPGIPNLLEPEAARAILQGRGAPTVSQAGEQFAVAALLYQLVCGADYCRFGLAYETLFQKIAEEPVRSFADNGNDPWPALEAVLRRALAKKPEDRFPSLAALCQALESVAFEAVPPAQGRDALATVVERVREHLELGGPALADSLPAPTASLKHGAAGTAFALYRWALQEHDASMLTLAELWSRRAQVALVNPTDSPEEAFYAPEKGLDRSILGTVTPFHTASGVHAVAAWVAAAFGDWREFRRAVELFVATSDDRVATSDDPGDSREEHRRWDLTLGRAGTLLFCALLEDRRLPDHPIPGLGRLAEQTLEDLWRHLDTLGPMGEAGDGRLGIAHGWGGQLYATLLWRSVVGGPLPPTFERRLVELARLAIPVYRGLAWPWQRLTAGDRSHRWMAGWCNGSSGLVSLWSLAATQIDQRYLELARGAAWNAWESAAEVSNLCCGLVGRTYGLLRCYRASGEDHWLDKARELATRAARHPQFDGPVHSLYRGELALALLALDLERPESAAFPGFETEGWRSR